MNRPGPSPRRLAAHVIAAAGLFACALALTACPEKKPVEPAASGSRHTYVVRGVVAMVPDPSHPIREFMVHHEAIPGFVRKDGTLGMNEMTMAFPLGEGASLAGIEVGDKVEVEFHVEWEPRARFWTSRVTELPEETALELRGAK